jgi:UDP-N-acetyl-L-fucosamine synthase
MNKIKLITVVGTRPEIIRLSRVIPKLDDYFEHSLIHTGQNYDYELNEIFFKDLKIRKPDYFLNAAGKNSAETIGKIIILIDEILEKIGPQAILVLGDTNSCMSVLPAKRRKIPIFHMEAGNRCFDQRVPEEINRKIIDHTADMNLTYSAIAREYLLREGLPPDLIIKTGSPMFEVLTFFKQEINESNILNKLELKKGKFFIVSAHREENIESKNNFIKLVDILNTIAKKYKFPIIFSAHPRTQNRIKELNIEFNPLIKILPPLGFFDYNKLQASAKAALSDSGTINEEASILNFAALNIREAHERPEGMEEASVMMVGLELQSVIYGLEILESQPTGNTRLLEIPNDYNVANVSDKIVRIILSYTDYINRAVWKNY